MVKAQRARCRDTERESNSIVGCQSLFIARNVTEDEWLNMFAETAVSYNDPAEGDSFRGIIPGTRFRDLPDDWTCPSCGTEKWRFSSQD